MANGKCLSLRVGPDQGLYAFGVCLMRGCALKCMSNYVHAGDSGHPHASHVASYRAERRRVARCELRARKKAKFGGAPQ